MSSFRLRLAAFISVIALGFGIGLYATTTTSVLNPASDLAGKTLVTAEGARTISGTWSLSVPIRMATGSAGVPGIVSTTDQTTGWQLGVGTIGGSISGVQRFLLNSSGLTLFSNSVFDSSGHLTVTSMAGFGSECQVRLTASSGVPVTTSDVIGTANVYVTSFSHAGKSTCSFYNGTSWDTVIVNELVIPLGTLTSGLPYDVFCYVNLGSPACDPPLAWTTGTSRNISLVQQDGVLVKTTDHTRRYMGTFLTTSATTTEDSYAKRYVWSYFNRRRRPMRVLETTDSWTYTTNTYREANGATTNQLGLVIGVAEDPVEITAFSIVSNTGPNPAWTSIGENSTTTPATGVLMLPSALFTAGGLYVNQATLRTIPAIGVNFYAWLEKSTAAGTTTWYGDNGTPTQWQSGITGWSEN